MFFCLPFFIGKRNWENEYQVKGGGDIGRYNALYCPDCRNYSVHPVRKREFITLLFIPVLPLYWGNQLTCRRCSWRQDFKGQGQLEKVVEEQKRVRDGGRAAVGGMV